MNNQKTILQAYQAQLEAVTDQTIGQLEDMMVDRVVDRLTSFLTGGGLQQRVSARLAPVHQEFQRSLLSDKNTSGQGFGKQLKSADLAGGNRDI